MRVAFLPLRSLTIYKLWPGLITYDQIRAPLSWVRTSTLCCPVLSRSQVLTRGEAAPGLIALMALGSRGFESSQT
ncbi:hypothetical protein RRG08_020220 [Elysia crispata]|uniref:Uncharacterized protein n=1 Tax=Elysia crispata TaxID=231223 RepID=A0AAE1A2H0_9GAST|nr:hypothetical protein RRG08_020220 [Elysia crispata]